MPRKWRQSDYDDDGYGDFDDEYDYEEEGYTEEKPTSTSSVAGENRQSSIPVQQPNVVEEPGMEEGFWGCSVCTFDNPLDSLTCDICDTPREEGSGTSTSSKEPADDVPKIQRASPLARALFKPLPGTKSDKPMSPAPFRSDVTGLSQKLGSKVLNLPFKFDTPSPDEKNLAARGLKKPPTRVAQSPDDILNGARSSMVN